MSRERAAARQRSRICRWALAWVLLLGPASAGTLAQPAPVPANDPRFREAYAREYEQLKGMPADMVVMELRDRIELVASRGSQVGRASNDRRVRGFESALLQGLQAAMCTGSPAAAGRPSPLVVDKINLAASTQHLRTQGTDVAELSALTQRLIDSQPAQRWCALKSLDEAR